MLQSDGGHCVGTADARHHQYGSPARGWGRGGYGDDLVNRGDRPYSGLVPPSGLHDRLTVFKHACDASVEVWKGPKR